MPIPVRLNKTTRKRIKFAARRLGSTTSAVIRFSVLNQLTQIEGGTIVLSSENGLEAGR